MAIAFKKPQRHTDWTAATSSFARLLVDGVLATTDPASTAQFAISAYPTTKKLADAIKGVEENAPENLAWSWLSLTVAESLARFLIIIRKDTILQTKHLDSAIDSFVEAALEVPETIHFDEDAIINPAVHPAFQSAIAQVPAFISRVTLKVRFDSQYWQRVFSDCIAPSSLSVLTINHSLMAALVENVAGYAGIGVRRELAWARHYKWLRLRFYQDAVFSPDGSVETPLSDLYLRLRCCWHQEQSMPLKDREDPRKTWKAFLGDLHQTVDAWLETETKNFLRVVAGGPGSGKSSFAKAVAAETALNGRQRVIFIELQRMTQTGDLYRDLGNYFTERNKSTGEDGSPGFGENPLEWIKNDIRPTLMVFDGLDEITHDSEKAKEISRNFLMNIEKLVRGQNQDGTKIFALVLGRNAACQEGMKAAALPLEVMLNVAPIRPLSKYDLRPSSADRFSDDAVEFPDMPAELVYDQRPEYWRLWCKSKGNEELAAPKAITDDALSDLNVEPLLLHLLILSEYCGPRWKEAADNRNVVYKDIIGQIHKRNISENKPGQKLELNDFFLLMECLGLASWRGNLRTGTSSTYVKIRDMHARSLQKSGQFEHADMDSMVLQTHARKIDGVDPGFEFIHKSFGEYLAARGLFTLAQRSKRRLRNTEDPTGEHEVSTEWVQLIDTAELTPEILRFFRDEVRQISDLNTLSQLKLALQDLLLWVNIHGMPVAGEPFRQIETVQRCAETALLVAGTSVALHLRQLDQTADALDVLSARHDAVRTLHRLGVTSGMCAKEALTGLNLSHTRLSKTDLSGADLRVADLEGVYLAQSSLDETDFSGSNLRNSQLYLSNGYSPLFAKADLTGSDLMGVQLHDAYFEGAKLVRTDFSGAVIADSNFFGANLSEAKFRRSILDSSNFQESDLTDCDFQGASVASANFDRANNLSQTSVSSMFGIRSGHGRTVLPEHIDYPDFWHDADLIEGSPTHDELSMMELAYRRSYQTWLNS